MTINVEEFKNNRDWQSAFHEAVNGDWIGWKDENIGPIENVQYVYYAVEGENDEATWLDIVLWYGNKVAVMEAGCDYTGWDCQASGVIDYYDSLREAISNLTPGQAERLGLSHDADKPKLILRMTLREFFQRFGTKLKAFEIAGIDEWGINEGKATNKDTVQLSWEQAEKLGITSYEFNDRAK